MNAMKYIGKFASQSVLQCSDDSYYTGVTNNLERRLKEHQEGIYSSSYTHSRRPVILKWYSEAISPNQAIALEKQIKGWTRRKKEALINKNWDKLKEYAECMNESSYKNHPSSPLRVTPRSTSG